MKRQSLFSEKNKKYHHAETVQKVVKVEFIKLYKLRVKYLLLDHDRV